ncbi:hypothetical protein C8F01DRAFT_1290205 [Mycena amicta]|nr:hypothetical protein C8F01DRAFT_1290205 [Mycena amicta]
MPVILLAKERGADAEKPSRLLSRLDEPFDADDEPFDADDEPFDADDDELEDGAGHGPPAPPNADNDNDDKTTSRKATPAESELDSQEESEEEGLSTSPPCKRRAVRPDSDNEDEWGLQGELDAGPNLLGHAVPKSQRAKAKSIPGHRALQRVRRTRMKEMNAELAKFQMKHKKREAKLVQRLAKKYDVRVGAVEKKVGLSTRWKTKRATSERAALIGYYCRTVNKECREEKKQAITLVMAQARVAKNPDLIKFSTELKGKIMAEYNARNHLKVTGSRGSACAEAKDVSGTAGKLAQDLTNLRRRTNNVAFAIVAPLDGNNSLAVATVADGGGARYMFERHNLTETEFLHDYANWASMDGKGIDGMNAKQLKDYCLRFINNGLAKAVGQATRMNYDNYPTAILKGLEVHLVGWPETCPWKSPSEMVKKPVYLCALATAIHNKECFWKEVSSVAQKEEAEKAYMELVARGLRPQPTERNGRSDKGKERGKKRGKKSAATVEEDESDNEGVNEGESIARNRGRRTNSQACAKQSNDKGHATKKLPVRGKKAVAEGDESDDGGDEGVQKSRGARTQPKTGNKDSDTASRPSKQSSKRKRPATENEDGRQVKKIKASSKRKRPAEEDGVDAEPRKKPKPSNEAHRRLLEQMGKSKSAPAPAASNSTAAPAANTMAAKKNVIKDPRIINIIHWYIR